MVSHLSFGSGHLLYTPKAQSILVGHVLHLNKMESVEIVGHAGRSLSRIFHMNNTN